MRRLKLSWRNMIKNKGLAMLGMASKAGKLTYGCQLVCTAIRNGRKPILVVLARDASANTKKRITNCCSYYNCPIITADFNTDELGHAIGRSGAIACVGVNDEGFANAIEERIKTALSEMTDNG